MDNLIQAALWAYRSWDKRSSAEEQDEAFKALKQALLDAGITDEEIEKDTDDDDDE